MFNFYFIKLLHKHSVGQPLLPEKEIYVSKPINMELIVHRFNTSNSCMQAVAIISPSLLKKKSIKEKRSFLTFTQRKQSIKENRLFSQFAQIRLSDLI